MSDSSQNPAEEVAHTVVELLRRSVVRRPDHEAIVTPEETLTYKQLDARIEAMVRSLLMIGAGKGTRIALLAPDGILWLTVFLAAMRIGAFVAPVSTLCTPPELAHILKHSDAQILIGTRRFLRHEYAERLVAALPGLVRAEKGQLFVKEAPYLRSIWLDDPTGCAWAGSLAELAAKGAANGGPDAELLRAMEAEIVPSDDAVMIYTSGTTSLPKAVVHAQRSVAEHSKVLADHFLIKETDRMMPLLPLFWVGGLTIALELLLHGGTLIYGGNPATEAVVENIIRFRANRINTWGPQLGRLRMAAAERGIDIDTIGGLAPQRGPDGQPIPLDRVANMLGMTESFGPHSSEPFNTVLPLDRKGSSGRATNDYERRVADPETGEILPCGQKGELQLRSGGLMKGYYKVDPRRLFTRDGFYPTGDLVRMEEDGHIYFEGRRGDMLKTAGANVSRLEVEAALRTVPEVGLPIVVGLPDAEAGQVIVAAIVPAEGTAPTEASLREALREKLSSYKIPRHIVLISNDDVQWTPSNKVRLTDMEKLLTKRLGR